MTRGMAWVGLCIDEVAVIPWQASLMATRWRVSAG